MFLIVSSTHRLKCAKSYGKLLSLMGTTPTAVLIVVLVFDFVYFISISEHLFKEKERDDRNKAAL